MKLHAVELLLCILLGASVNLLTAATLYLRTYKPLCGKVEPSIREITPPVNCFTRCTLLDNCRYVLYRTEVMQCCLFTDNEVLTNDPCYQIPLPYFEKRTLQLLSLNKPTHQSTIFFNGNPSKAVDGVTNQNYNQYSCTHTGQDENPWWEVDLGAIFNIHYVVVYNRKDCCGDRLSYFSVWIQKSNQTAYTKCAQYPSLTTNGQIISLPCKDIGRYVKIQLPGLAYLSLCEVQIFGY